MKQNLSRRFHDAFESCGLTVDELWLRYFALGGDAGQFELDAYLNGAIALPPVQHDMLAHAINERLDEIASARAPYSKDFTVLFPESGRGANDTDVDDEPGETDSA
jgi:hypothetical protein